MNSRIEQLCHQGVQVALTIKTKGTLTEALRTWIQAHKGELIAELSQCPHCYVTRCDVCHGDGDPCAVCGSKGVRRYLKESTQDVGQLAVEYGQPPVQGLR
jgi:hypothetical protein